jgi:TatD DNase family protein
MDPLATIPDLPTLDAHAHIAAVRTGVDLRGIGAVLAMTISLDEAEMAAGHDHDLITWGVGCHPRMPRYQNEFKSGRFSDLLQHSPIAGEIGLDGGSRVPMLQQTKVFREALEVLSGLPRLVSIHSYQATGMVLRELRNCPVNTPVLHWWTGSAIETSEAVELGCYFSIHSAVARQSKFRTRVPLERVLVESDHGYNDPPAAIPCRAEWVEYLVAQQYKMDVTDLRRKVWCNLAEIVRNTGTLDLYPKPLVERLNRQSVEGMKKLI